MDYGDFVYIMKLSELYAKDRSYAESISFQLLKMQEELGEATQAFIGVTGANPRKGLTGTYGDVADEIIDVIITGFVALETVLVAESAAALKLYYDDRKNYILDRALNAKSEG